MNYEQQIGEFYVLKTLQTFYPKDLVGYGNYQLEKKMGERNYSKTSRICYISDCQFPEHFSEGHWPIMCCLYKQWCWYNEHSCENNSTKDPNNQVLSKSQDSNWAPTIESNIESNIIGENGQLFQYLTQTLVQL